MSDNLHEYYGVSVTTLYFDLMEAFKKAPPVPSTMVSKVVILDTGDYADNHTLAIDFGKDDTYNIYVYPNFTEEERTGLDDAESVGKWVLKFRVGRKCFKLTDDPEHESGVCLQEK